NTGAIGGLSNRLKNSIQSKYAGQKEKSCRRGQSPGPGKRATWDTWCYWMLQLFFDPEVIVGPLLVGGKIGGGVIPKLLQISPCGKVLRGVGMLSEPV